MPRWEVCRIENRARVEKVFFSERVFVQLNALADTPQGNLLIDQSPEWDRDKVGHETIMRYRSELVGRLLADGWEPIQVNEMGLVTTFKRQVP